MRCSNCRTDNLPSNNFCAKCGNALAKRLRKVQGGKPAYLRLLRQVRRISRRIRWRRNPPPHLSRHPPPRRPVSGAI